MHNSKAGYIAGIGPIKCEHHRDPVFPCKLKLPAFLYSLQSSRRTCLPLMFTRDLIRLVRGTCVDDDQRGKMMIKEV